MAEMTAAPHWRGLTLTSLLKKVSSGGGGGTRDALKLAGASRLGKLS